MKGFKCNSCGHQFIYPKESRENVGFKENPYWETEYLCPKCKCGDIEEAELVETEELLEQERDEWERREMEAMYEFYYCM